jgi:TetR/AcrR family transcriptional regulator
MVGARRTAVAQPGAGAPGADGRAKTLLAATKLLAAHGFDGTSVQDIADALGVTKQAVLHHFPSKESIREAVLDEILQHWNERLPKLLLAATASEDRFDAVFGELFTFFFIEPDRARLILREALDRPDVVRRLLEGPVRPWLRAVAGYIDSGVERGQHHTGLDPEAYVLNVLLFVLSAAAGVHVMPAALGTADAQTRYARELSRIARSSLFRAGATSKDAPAALEAPAPATTKRKAPRSTAPHSKK